MTDPSVFASGTTTGGVPWEAVEYMTRAGWICIDFRYWQVPAERSDLAALGGCFIDGSPETGRVMGNIWPSRETAVVGLLEGPSSGLGPEPVKHNETRARQFFCASLPIVGSLIHATVGSFASSGRR
ncbi:MAG: hypothetical protein ACRDQ2_05620, partial [Gaiellales bacterium]